MPLKVIADLVTTWYLLHRHIHLHYSALPVVIKTLICTKVYIIVTIWIKDEVIHNQHNVHIRLDIVLQIRFPLSS